MENAFYNKENLNPDIHEKNGEENKITIPEGVDPELLMKVLGNPEMAALLTSLAKTMKYKYRRTILCGVRNLCSIVFFVSCEKICSYL